MATPTFSPAWNRTVGKSSPLTPAHEVAAWQAFAELLGTGTHSYTGDWVHDELPGIERDITSDFFPRPSSMATARAEAAQIVTDAKAEAARILDAAKAEAERLLAAGRAKADKERDEMRNALYLAAQRLEHIAGNI